MKSITILLDMTKKVQEFVSIVQEVPCELLLKSGKFVVDPKSILGIYSLDLTKPLTMEIYCDDCAELLEKLAKFEA